MLFSLTCLYEIGISGIVSKIFPADTLVDEAVKLGEKISQHSQLIVAFAKEAVNTGTWKLFWGFLANLLDWVGLFAMSGRGKKDIFG